MIIQKIQWLFKKCSRWPTQFTQMFAIRLHSITTIRPYSRYEQNSSVYQFTMGHNSTNLAGLLLLRPKRVISGGASGRNSSVRSSVSSSGTALSVVGKSLSGGFGFPRVLGFLPRGFLATLGGGKRSSNTAGLQFSQFQTSYRGSPLALDPT